MPSMWSLDKFRFDDAIPGSEVFVLDEDHGELVSLTKAEAIHLARSRDMALIAKWPAFPDEEDVSCAIGKLTVPIRWEQLSEAVGDRELDENLWFEAKCGGREPDPPNDADGDTTPADLQAWLSATARFRRTGSWYGRWGTCDQCGCVLLPDSAADFCDEHQPPA